MWRPAQETEITAPSKGGTIQTDGEVQNARLADGYRVDLFVLSRVEVSIAGGVVTAGAGVQRRIENWSPESERLAATVYRYQLP